jgi:hypothetical protein
MVSWVSSKNSVIITTLSTFDPKHHSPQNNPRLLYLIIISLFLKPDFPILSSLNILPSDILLSLRKRWCLEQKNRLWSLMVLGTSRASSSYSKSFELGSAFACLLDLALRGIFFFCLIKGYLAFFLWCSKLLRIFVLFDLVQVSLCGTFLLLRLLPWDTAAT